jgi:hypothetical protein
MYNTYRNSLIKDYIDMFGPIESEHQEENIVSPGRNPDYKPDQYEKLKVSEFIYRLDWNDIIIDINTDEDWGEQIKPDCKNLLDKIETGNFTYTECEGHYKGSSKEKHDNQNSVIPKSTCAWYTSYHYGLANFGIHMKESCLIKIAKYFWKHNYPYTRTKNDALRSSFFYLLTHELFHFITDQAATVVELILQEPNLYKKYTRNVYIPSYINPPDGALEESLANRYVYGRYEFLKVNKNLLFNMMKAQPIGYNNFDIYRGDYKMARRKLINHIVEQSSMSHPYIGVESIFDIINPRLFYRGDKIPIWMHYKKGKKKISFK